MSHENPDIVALRAFMASGEPVAVASSPLLHALGARFVAHDPEAGTLTMEFQPSDLFRQGGGSVQGGAVGAMLDFAMAFAAFTVLEEERFGVTVALNTQFCGAASSGSLTAVGRIDKAGRKMIFASGELRQGDRLIATGSRPSLLPDRFQADERATTREGPRGLLRSIYSSIHTLARSRPT